MPKFNDNQKSLIILGVGVAAAIGVGGMGYLHWQDYQEVKADKATLQATHDKNQKEIDRERELKHQVVAYGSIVAENAKILPTEEDLNQFIRDLGTLEKDTGVSIRVLPSFTPTKDKRDPTIVRIPMKLTLTATTRNFLSFLNQLENRERLVTVTDFRFSPAGEDAKPGQDLEHDVSMSFDVYKYDPAGAKEREDLVTAAETLLMRESNEVKEIIKKEGKPTFLEKYRLARVKESRRDLFLDPRRRTGKVGEEAVDNTRELEAVRLEALRILYEKARLELESYREAEANSTDFLRRSAAKRAFQVAFEQFSGEIGKVSRRSPEFASRDIQDRYVVEVKRPYEKLVEDSRDLGTAPATGITEEQAKGYHGEVKALADERKFKETVDKWLAVETLVKDAGKNIEDKARPHIDRIRVLGEHAQYQVLLAQRKIQVQGVVQMNRKVEAGEGAPPGAAAGGDGTMERVSAVIINGRFLKPGEYLDKDLVFRGVDPDGRLLFTFIVKKADTGAVEKHDVDYVQQQPDLLEQQSAILGQE